MLSIAAIVASLAALAIPALSSADVRDTTVFCNGFPAGIFWNGTEIPADKEIRVVNSPQLSNIISGSFAYNGHGGAPCTSLFALGITKSKTAPKSIIDSAWVDRVAIGGNQGNDLVLDSHVVSGHYNVFLVQYDPATGEVVADVNGQSKAKICYRGIYPLGGVHDPNPCDV